MFDRDDAMIIVRAAGYGLVALVALIFIAVAAGCAVAVFRLIGGL